MKLCARTKVTVLAKIRMRSEMNSNKDLEFTKYMWTTVNKYVVTSVSASNFLQSTLKKTSLFTGSYFLSKLCECLGHKGEQECGTNSN